METGAERLSPPTASDDLYEVDFHAWTQHQAALLRNGHLHRLDTANILEEIESLGRKEFSELRSRLRILTAHLLEATYQPDRSSRSWTTILNRRIAIADHLADNPSLKPRLVEAFAKAYEDGRDLAASETGLPLATFPATPSFSYEDAVSRSWNPRPAD